MDKQIIALFPGAFKPPTRGHFEIVEKVAKICNEVQVIISSQSREGYGPYISEKVWRQYKKLLPENVVIKVSSSPSPITEIYQIVKDKSKDYIVVYGKGEQKRYKHINENRQKYENVDVFDVGNIEEISSTRLRKAINKRNLKEIKKLIPEGIKVNDFLLNFQLHEIKVNKPVKFWKFDTELKVGDKVRIPDKFMKDNIFVYLGGDILQDKETENNYSITAMRKMHELDLEQIKKGTQTQVIDESKNLGDLYHFTDLINLDKIVGSNYFKPSSISTQDHQRDFQSLPKERRKKLQDKGEKYLYYISLTRDKFLHIKNPKLGTPPLTRIKFDGNKLSTKYKFIPFNYYSDDIDSEYERYRSNEGEERIILPDELGIKNVNNYIIEIDILLDKIEDNETYLKQAEELVNKYQNINLLYKEKPVTMEEYKKTILPTIDPYKDGEFLEVIDKTLNEVFTPQNHQSILDRAVEWGCTYLQIEKPQINFINDPNYVQQHSSFGGYNPGDKSITVSVYNRNTADICRSTFHEMIHAKQDIEGRLNLEAGKDGDPYENEANAIAGKMLRKLGRELPEIFEI